MFFIDLLTASHVLESITISASAAGDREAFAIRSDRVDCVSPGELLDTEIRPARLQRSSTSTMIVPFPVLQHPSLPNSATVNNLTCL